MNEIIFLSLQMKGFRVEGEDNRGISHSSHLLSRG